MLSNLYYYPEKEVPPVGVLDGEDIDEINVSSLVVFLSPFVQSAEWEILKTAFETYEKRNGRNSSISVLSHSLGLLL